MKKIRNKTNGRLSAIYECSDHNFIYKVYKTKTGWTKEAINSEYPSVEKRPRLSDFQN